MLSLSFLFSYVLVLLAIEVVAMLHSHEPRNIMIIFYLRVAMDQFKEFCKYALPHMCIEVERLFSLRALEASSYSWYNLTTKEEILCFRGPMECRGATGNVVFIFAQLRQQGDLYYQGLIANSRHQHIHCTRATDRLYWCAHDLTG